MHDQINCNERVLPALLHLRCPSQSHQPTFSPWTHTSDDSYIYQLSLVLATATVSYVITVLSQHHAFPRQLRVHLWRFINSPRLGFVAETGRFVAMETPWVRFSCLILCLASYFSFFVFVFFLFSLFLFFFPASRHVYLLRVPLSVQQPSATLSKYVFYGTCSFCLSHLYPTPSRNSFVFLFV